jgi:tetratricopeptide (TPR) repeat protein
MANSGNPKPYERAVTAHEAGDLEGAAGLYRQSGEAGEVDGWFQLGAVLLDLGRDDEAFDAYRTAAAAGDAEARLNVANMLADHYDRAEEALDVYRQAIEAGDPRALTESGTVLARLGRSEEAQQQLRQAVADGDPRAHLQLGMLLGDAGDLDGAAAEYQRAVDAEVSGSWAELALLKEEAGDQEEAEEILRAGVAHDDPWAYGGLGSLLFEQGHLEQADALFKEALARGHSEVWLPYGICLADWEEHEGEAESAYRAAIELGDEVARLAYGELLLQMGRRDEAMAQFQQASAAGFTDDVARLLDDLGVDADADADEDAGES